MVLLLRKINKNIIKSSLITTIIIVLTTNVELYQLERRNDFVRIGNNNIMTTPNKKIMKGVVSQTPVRNFLKPSSLSSIGEPFLYPDKMSPKSFTKPKPPKSEPTTRRGQNCRKPIMPASSPISRRKRSVKEPSSASIVRNRGLYRAKYNMKPPSYQFSSRSSKQEHDQKESNVKATAKETKEPTKNKAKEPKLIPGLDEKEDMKVFSAEEVSKLHGFLSEQDIRHLVRTTNYNRRELYTLFIRFKALCSISLTPEGVDKETFRKGVPMLSVEDDLFVDRVFSVLDTDGSGSIEWEEFIEAMSALEKGSREKRTEFLFKVYDINGEGGISREGLYKFFLSSLMVSVDENIKEVSEYFVDQVFHSVDADLDGKLTFSEALSYIESHPEVRDIYGMFGRSMTSAQLMPLTSRNDSPNSKNKRHKTVRDSLLNKQLSARVLGMGRSRSKKTLQRNGSFAIAK